MQALLAQLLEANVRLDVRDGKLQVNAPAGVLTPELQHRLREQRDALVAFLSQEHWDDGNAEALPQLVPDLKGRHQPFPLNAVQHAYWMGRQAYFELGNVCSHMYFELDCDDLDLARLGQALNRVVRRHDMLRAVVGPDGTQRILEQVPDYLVPTLDLRADDRAHVEAELTRARARLSERMVAPDQWPLFAVEAARVDERHTRLFLSWDFLVTDAWSLMLIFRQWEQCYREPGVELPSLDISFRDYVLAEPSLRSLPAYQTSRRYWWDRIDSLPPAPLLPTVGKIEPGKRHRFQRRRFQMPEPQWRAIKARARAAGLTPTSVVLAAFAEILNRWSKTPHYCLNLTLFNRQPVHDQVDQLVGDFTNLMVLEVDGRAGDSFLLRARALQDRFLQDFEHQRVSGTEVMREMARRRNLKNTALLPVVFTSTLMLDGRRSEDFSVLERFGKMSWGISQTPQVWLDYQLFEHDGSLLLNWDCVDEVVRPGVLDAMFAANCRLLEALASGEQVWEAEETELLPQTQTARRIAANQTAAPVTWPALHQPFVEQALRAPRRVALQWSGGEMSYGELLAQSDALARRLVKAGVQPNQLVAVLMEKGWEQAVATLAILIAGAAYLPIDPRWPYQRRGQVLTQGEVRICLTQPQLATRLEWQEQLECLVVERDPQAALPGEAPPLRQRVTDLAYVIFTSGSTGVPKGVMIDHRGAVNTVEHINRLFAVGPEDKALALSELGFDLSVYDIFGMLGAGGTVVLPDPNRAREPAHWDQLVREAGVTVWNSVPQFVNLMVDHAEAQGSSLAGLRLVMMSGDWIPTRLPDRLRRLAPDVNVISLGGATEGSIWSIYYPIGTVDPSWDSIPYGKALPNQHMYVLNRRMEPCPDHVTGDIYIGGAGVALGYWKDAERTAQQFVRHPRTGEALYWTGDLGRYMEDGNIEFLGREDAQVKLRGYRVELGEIVAALQACPGVSDAAVQVIREDGRASLTAYLVVDKQAGAGLFQAVAVDPAAWAAVAQQVGDRMAGGASGAQRADLELFARFWHDMEQACVQSMLETFRALELLDVDLQARLDELERVGELKGGHRRLLLRWLDVLVRGGRVLSRSPRYQRCPGPEVPLTQQLQALQLHYGGDERVAAFLEHAVACLAAQRALLAGRVSPLELLFPNGSWRHAEALYQRNPVVLHHNRLLAQVARAALGGAADRGMINVLEVGAGTGGSTAALLPALPAGRTSYLYTDVSSYFFAQAGEKFAPYPFIDFALYDIDKDAKAQGYRPHSYDLIVAANVLHNARDMALTLGALRELLKPGGYLLMLEASANTPWQYVTVGYLEGEGGGDARSDGDGLGLSAADWKRALQASGFEQVAMFPSGDGLDAELSRWLEAMPQQVIAARAPADAALFQPARLREQLSQRLPDYMVPQHFMLLDRLPLSANGKVDVAALPRRGAGRGAAGAQLVPPASQPEEQILAIWKEVLRTGQIGISDNFFDIGGDSLLLTEVQRKLNQEQGLSLTVAELFAHPTVQALACHIASLKAAPSAEAVAPAAQAAPAAMRGREIAIIGMAGRFPDAADVDQFWTNIAAGHCAVRQFSDDELRRAGVSEEELADPRYVKAGLVLAGMDQFDAAYFGVAPRDALIMDPQQRFLLECAHQALEHAGYPAEGSGSRIGVFVGKGTPHYLVEHVLPDTALVDQVGLLSILHAHEKDHAATLISYKLNLTGPSLSINTGCSTSLVTVHAACQSLLNGECEVALAGGVGFVDTRAQAGYLYREGEIASPDGFCRAFSDEANGAVFGSGVGLVVLKPLAEAMRDGDTIHAVLKATAVNNDGARKVGYMAPSLEGQAAVIADALAKADVAPESIGYIEGHGTGTRLGDPIEVGALRKAYGGARADGSRVALGSVKSNIGHLDCAAGVAGLIKMVQALRHGQLPATLHAQVPSRHIDFADSPFMLPGSTRPWPAAGQPRRAAVSSFGVGGTNAHAILEEAPARALGARGEGCQLLVLSAPTRAALTNTAQALAAHLERHPEMALADVALTLQAGRRAHRYRSYLVCTDIAGAIAALHAPERLPVSEYTAAHSTPVAFLLPGQGVQQQGCTESLYRRYPAFRKAFDECAALVQAYCGVELRTLLYQAEDPTALDQTALTQPLLFSIEYALARFWLTLGVHPAALLGHSLGEYVAACLAGVFTLEEAMSLVVVRGQLIQSLPAGCMLAVSAGPEELAPYLAAGDVALAAVNSPVQCVLSGAAAPISAVQARLEAGGVTCHQLNTSHAFHSAMMDDILDTYAACLGEVALQAPRIPYVSCVTGGWIDPAQATSPDYWVCHLRQTVQFARGVQQVAALPHVQLLEVGPGRTLSTLARSGATLEHPPLASLAGHASEEEAIVHTIGQLWQRGVAIDWTALHPDGSAGRVPLPGYSFERRRYWLERRGHARTTPPIQPPAAAPAPNYDADVMYGDLGQADSGGHERPDLTTPYRAPEGPLEQRLAQVWSEHLGVARIGVDDNFFDLGGDSLLATRMYARVRQEFGVELPIQRLFAMATVRKVGLFIRASRDEAVLQTLSEQEVTEFFEMLGGE